MGAYIIWWAIAVHIVWGTAMIIDTSVYPLAILVGLHWILALAVDPPFVGMMLIAAALMAALSLLAGKRLPNLLSLVLLLPQYAILIAALVADTQSVVTGVVEPSPNVLDRVLIFTALWPVMIAAALHSVAIVERHRKWNRI